MRPCLVHLASHLFGCAPADQNPSDRPDRVEDGGEIDPPRRPVGRPEPQPARAADQLRRRQFRPATAASGSGSGQFVRMAARASVAAPVDGGRQQRAQPTCCGVRCRRYAVEPLGAVGCRWGLTGTARQKSRGRPVRARSLVFARDGGGVSTNADGGGHAAAAAVGAPLGWRWLAVTKWRRWSDRALTEQGAEEEAV